MKSIKRIFSLLNIIILKHKVLFIITKDKKGHVRLKSYCDDPELPKLLRESADAVEKQQNWRRK